MTQLPDFCHECGHYQPIVGLRGLCWRGSEDNGPDEAPKYGWCEDHTREPFKKLHPGVKVKE